MSLQVGLVDVLIPQRNVGSAEAQQTLLCKLYGMSGGISTPLSLALSTRVSILL